MYACVGHSKSVGIEWRFGAITGPTDSVAESGVPRGGGVWGVQIPPLREILNARQNRARLNPIVKAVKNC